MMLNNAEMYGIKESPSHAPTLSRYVAIISIDFQTNNSIAINRTVRIENKNSEL